jgi:hypothetical protein
VDYGALIRDAWQTTWRHRFLWILGLFAGGAVGVSSAGGGGDRTGGQWPAGPGEVERIAPAGRLAEEVGRWAAANGAVLAGAVLVALLLGLALLVVSVIAQGGMAEATVDLAAGRPSSLAVAWGAGRRLFWRYAGLYLLLAGAAIAAAAVVAVVTVVALVPVAAAASVAPALADLAIVVVAPLALAVIAAAIALSIVVAYAQRAVYAEDAGPAAALRAGWRVLREHPGASVLVWLVNLALAFGAGIVLALAFAAVAVVLVGLGVGVWAIASAAAPRAAYAVMAAVVIITGVTFAVAVSNTFFWTYWTLAYLRLTGMRGEPAAF